MPAEAEVRGSDRTIARDSAAAMGCVWAVPPSRSAKLAARVPWLEERTSSNAQEATIERRAPVLAGRKLAWYAPPRHAKASTALRYAARWGASSQADRTIDDRHRGAAPRCCDADPRAADRARPWHGL